MERQKFDFEKLLVYEKALHFHSQCIPLFKRSYTSKALVDQANRSGMSIVLNIAESSGKFAPKDRRNFLLIARGSLYETVAALDILTIEHPSLKDEAENIKETASEVAKMLTTMIKNLEAISSS